MRIALSVAFGFAFALAACGQEPEPAKPAPPAYTGPNISYAEIPPTSGYPLKTCVVTGKELRAAGNKPYVISYKGYEVQFCCDKCIDEFAKNPDKYVYMVNPKAMIPK